MPLIFILLIKQYNPITLNIYLFIYFSFFHVQYIQLKNWIFYKKKFSKQGIKILLTRKGQSRKVEVISICYSRSEAIRRDAAIVSGPCRFY